MDNPGEGFANARSDTAHEKPAFRDAWATRSCRVLFSGVYRRSRPSASGLDPEAVHREADFAFAMAGLWEEWRNDDGHRLRTVAVLTTDPNDILDSIHDRMPVVLPREDETRWLTADPDDRPELCCPYSGDDLAADPIYRLVNAPSNDDTRLIEPLDIEQTDIEEFSGVPGKL